MSLQDSITKPASTTPAHNDNGIEDLPVGQVKPAAKGDVKSETISDSKSRKSRGFKKPTTADNDKQFASVATRIRKRTQKGVLMLVENGRDLLLVKEKMGHGNFGTWLKREFGWSERTAQNYMSATKAYDEFLIQGCISVRHGSMCQAPFR